MSGRQRLPLGLGLMMAGATRRDVEITDTDALAIIAGYASAPSNIRQTAIQDFVLALKAASIWAELDGLHVIASAEAQGARINWVSPGTRDLSATGSPTFTVDQSFTAGTGAYHSTGFNPTSTVGRKFAQNDGFQLVGIMGVPAETSGAFPFGNANSRIQPKASTNLFRVFANTSVQDSGGGTPAKGLYGWSRSAAGSFVPYENGVALTTVTRNSAALTNANFLVGTHDGSVISTKPVSLVAFGSALDGTQMTAFYNAYVAYMAAIGQSAT